MPFRQETWDHNEWARRLYIAIVVLSAVTMGILFYMIQNDRNEIRRQAVEIKGEATLRSNQIQEQRYEVTLHNCQDQNKRHDTTIRTLDKIISRQPAEQRAMAKANEKFTILLIDALVPKKNCKAVANKAVHPVPVDKSGR